MCQYPGNAVVNATSAEIVPQNFYRTGLFIRNLDTAKTIYLAFGHPAEIGKGVALYPKEAFSMSPYDYSTEAIFAIASSTGAPISIQEFDLSV